MTRIVKIGTRRSPLALKQADAVRRALEAKTAFAVEIVEYVTTGDRSQAWGDHAKVSGKGDFVKEIEEALLAGDIDIAVHSMKDMPAHLPEGVVIDAVLPRNDYRDVVLCRTVESLEMLKDGAVVGTGAMRRVAQLKAMFPHLQVKPVRGNIGTRIEKMENGDFDALILAKAGMDLLGLSDKIRTVLEPDIMLPALCQGIIGIECRRDDAELRSQLKHINDEETWACLRAERALIAGLGGDCHTPMGGYCVVTKNRNLRLIAMVSMPDGACMLRSRHKMAFDEAEALGQLVAEDLISQGADKIIADMRAAS